MRNGVIAAEYLVPPQANAERASPDAVLLRATLLAELGVPAGPVDA
ncbi:MAG: hypothetical protein WDN49_17955 [Acetobacteraceae bacterium]